MNYSTELPPLGLSKGNIMKFSTLVSSPLELPPADVKKWPKAFAETSGTADRTVVGRAARTELAVTSDR